MFFPFLIALGAAITTVYGKKISVMPCGQFYWLSFFLLLITTQLLL